MKKILFGALTLLLCGFTAAAGLKIYGPGGPSAPIEEAAKIFSARKGVSAQVVFGPQPKWIDAALMDADIVYGGAEYMLTNTEMQHKQLVDRQERYELFPREMAIIVRKGNPKKIKSLKDLTRPGIKILDVNGAGQLGLWEDIAGKAGLIEGIQKNNAEPFASNAQGVAAWRSDRSYDAWINFASWQKVLHDDSDLVAIPKQFNVLRGTPIALTRITKNRALAKEFIHFLKSDEGHAIFRKHGWR